MCEVLRVKDPAEMPRVLDWIHDQIFDSEGIALDSATDTLVIPFAWADYEHAKKVWGVWPFGKAEVKTFLCFLRIHHAKGFSVRDTERIRFYDFNTLKYDAQARRISLSTGVPFRLAVTVVDSRFRSNARRRSSTLTSRFGKWASSSLKEGAGKLATQPSPSVSCRAKAPLCVGSQAQACAQNAWSL